MFVFKRNVCKKNTIATVEGKKPVPFDEVLTRDSKMFQELGFVYVNDLCKFETSLAFVYPNKLGKTVINAWSI